MVNYISKPAYKAVAHFGQITPTAFKGYFTSLIFWGTATVFGLATFTEAWPLFQKNVYSKIPVLGKHWQKEVDPQDLPI
ncbi:DEKNAAC104914 [Brettanomyces naardenensis]|uniref:DEKNAAC104914 n=1 Tax=Brettanomyces naardenensis TaxID=13370 RepID=A0A448YRZ6_BRENA|nr:DEKNAAC104914 [Brettanomyces naardenensis]